MISDRKIINKFVYKNEINFLKYLKTHVKFIRKRKILQDINQLFGYFSQIIKNFIVDILRNVFIVNFSLKQPIECRTVHQMLTSMHIYIYEKNESGRTFTRTFVMILRFIFSFNGSAVLSSCVHIDPLLHSTWPGAATISLSFSLSLYASRSIKQSSNGQHFRHRVK